MATDALVAMTILVSMIIVALGAAHQGLRASRAGLEVRQANDLLKYVVENAHGATGVTTGQTDLFTWRLAVGDPIPSATMASLCDLDVSLVSRRSLKTYGVRTNEICPATPS